MPFVDFIILASSISGAIYLATADGFASGYSSVWVLPSVFTFAYLVYLRSGCLVSQPIFRILLVGAAYLRFVLSPILIGYLGQFSSISAAYVPSGSEVEMAILLMSLELLAYISLLYIFDQRLKVRPGQRPTDMVSGRRRSPPRGRIRWVTTTIALPRSYLSLGLIILSASLGLLAINPSASQYFTFVTPRSEEFGLHLSDVDLATRLLIVILVVAKHSLFLLGISWSARRYRATSRGHFALLGGLFTALNSLLYYGTNRLDAISVAIASALVFLHLFPRYAKAALAPLALGTFVLLQNMTSARGYFDYFEGISGVERVLRSTEYQINSYLGGVHNVSIGVQTAAAFPLERNASHLFYDLVRPIVGLNELVKDWNIYSSNDLFNFVYFQRDHVAVIQPAVAQGYFYFGILAAIVPLFLMLPALSIESTLRRAVRLEYFYILVIALVRLGTATGSNTTNVLNSLSIQVVIPLVLFWVGISFFEKARLR